MQLTHNQTTGMDKSNSGPQIASPIAQNGARHSAQIRVGKDAVSLEAQSDSLKGILAILSLLVFGGGAVAACLIILWKTL